MSHLTVFRDAWTFGVGLASIHNAVEAAVTCFDYTTNGIKQASDDIVDEVLKNERYLLVPHERSLLFKYYKSHESTIGVQDAPDSTAFSHVA